MLDLHNLPGFDAPCNLPPYRPQALADSLRDFLHIISGEGAGERREYRFACGGGVGVGHGDALGAFPVEDVEDVVVVDGDDADDVQSGLEVGVGAFYPLRYRAGLHQPEN